MIVRGVLSNAIPVDGAGRACLCCSGAAGAFRPARGAARRRYARPVGAGRLPGLRRAAGLVSMVVGWRGAQSDALLRLFAVRHAVELSAHQMRALRLDRGHRLSGNRRRTRRRSRPKPANPAAAT